MIMSYRSTKQPNKQSFPSLARRSEKQSPSLPDLESTMKDDTGRCVVELNLDKFPEKSCFTYQEIAERWSRDVRYIEQLIDDELLRTAVKLEELPIVGLVINIEDLEDDHDFSTVTTISMREWTGFELLPEQDMLPLDMDIKNAKIEIPTENLITKSEALRSENRNDLKHLYFLPGSMLPLTTFRGDKVLLIHKILPFTALEKIEDIWLGIINKKFFKYITKDERDRFEKENGITALLGIETQDNPKPSTQDKREIVLQKWIKSNQINTEIPLDETRQELWGELGLLNPGLFPPSSPSTLKDFFQAQSICHFKKGRRKGG